MTSPSWRKSAIWSRIPFIALNADDESAAIPDRVALFRAAAMAVISSVSAPGDQFAEWRAVSRRISRRISRPASIRRHRRLDERVLLLGVLLRPRQQRLEGDDAGGDERLAEDHPAWVEASKRASEQACKHVRST